MTRRVHTALVAGVLVGLSATASAAPSDADRDRASARYREGLAAHDKKDFPAAARHFAEADAIAPNAVALGAALDAAVDADDPVLGQELLDRAAERGGRPPELDNSIANARAKLGGRAGKIRASCAPETTCQATLDGATVKPGAWTYARAGAHDVVFTTGTEREVRRVTLQGGEGLEIAASKRAATPPAATIAPPTGTADRAAPPPPPPGEIEPKRRRGISPIVFYLAAGGTVLAAGGGVAGAFITKSKHDDFVAAGCPSTTSDACDDRERTGKQTQLVTNILFAGAGVGLIATTVIGLVLVDWRGGDDTAPKQTSRVRFGVAPTPGGFGAGLEGRF